MISVVKDSPKSRQKSPRKVDKSTRQKWDFFKGMYPILRKQGMDANGVALLAGLIDEEECEILDKKAQEFGSHI